MNALLDLADRCERAEGPDRELDRLIALRLGATEASITSISGRGFVRYTDENGSTGGPLPPYTASIDAAMTLDDPTLAKFGGAMGLLREAMDRLYRADKGIDALARFWVAAFLRARAAT